MIFNSMYIKYCFFIILLLFLSCNDRESNISENYSFFVDSGYGEITGKNVITNRANVYPNVIDFRFDEKFILVKQIPNKEKYSINLGRDLYNIYLLYSQIPAHETLHYFTNSDSVIYSIFKTKGATIDNTSEDIRIRTEIADSFIINDPYYKKIFSNDTNYWIIQIANDSLIGPLTKSEFEVTRKEMQIPDKLKLD